jgi:hypothetical protein
MKHLWIALLAPVLAAGCTAASDGNVAADNIADNGAGNGIAMIANDAVLSNSADTAFVWPDTLRVVGDGYPNAGDVCRRIGESAATVDYLDDSATLVGCPGDASSTAALALTGRGAKLVGTHEGVTLISVLAGDANPGPGNKTEAKGE